MSILLRYPTDLVCSIVSQWVELRDVAQLDNAYCNKRERPNFLGGILTSACCWYNMFPM